VKAARVWVFQDDFDVDAKPGAVVGCSVLEAGVVPGFDIVG
jgi:hypothetical protein